MIYRYRADDGAIVELERSMLQPIPESILRDGKVYTRVFEAVSIVYKGTGFYTTDKSDSIDRWRREHLARD